MFTGQVFVTSHRSWRVSLLYTVLVHLLHRSSDEAVGVGVLGYLEVRDVEFDVVRLNYTLPLLIRKSRHCGIRNVVQLRGDSRNK